MAGQTSQNTGGQVNQRFVAQNLAVSVPGAGNTVLLTMPVAGLKNLGVSVAPTVQAFDAFVIEGQFNPSGPFVTLFNATGDFTTPKGLMIGASGDLTLLAAAATGWFVMNVQGLHAVRVSASAAADSALVDAYAGGS